MVRLWCGTTLDEQIKPQRFPTAGGEALPTSTYAANAARLAQIGERVLAIKRPGEVCVDGTGMPLVGQIIIFVGGILPALLAVTGILMWLRMRRRRERHRTSMAALAEAEALAT